MPNLQCDICPCSTVDILWAHEPVGGNLNIILGIMRTNREGGVLCRPNVGLSMPTRLRKRTTVIYVVFGKPTHRCESQRGLTNRGRCSVICVCYRMI